MTLISNIKAEISPKSLEAGKKQYFIGHHFQSTDLRQKIKSAFGKLGLSPYIADQELTNDLLLRKVCGKIWTTRASVIDISSASNNVYLELGVAVGLNKPVFVTVKEQDDPPLPQLLQGFAQITFASYGALEQRLVADAPGWFQRALDHETLYPNHCHFVSLRCDDRNLFDPQRRFLVIDEKNGGKHATHPGTAYDADLREVLTKAFEGFADSAIYLNDVPADSDLRFCDYCRALRRSRYAICCLSRHSSPHVYLLLGLVMGLDIPVLLLVHEEKNAQGKPDFELPTLLKGLDYFPFSAYTTVADALPDMMKVFLNSAQERPKSKPAFEYVPPPIGIVNNDRSKAIKTDDDVDDIRSNTYDVFISHASEDKATIARPLANALIDRGFKVWLDAFELTLGDSLRRSIEHGLSNSRFGVVILSHAFFGKEWPQRELDSLAAMEIDNKKVILPVWHSLERQDIVQYSPLLADKLAVSTSKGIDEVASQIAAAIRKAASRVEAQSIIVGNVPLESEAVDSTDGQATEVFQSNPDAKSASITPGLQSWRPGQYHLPQVITGNLFADAILVGLWAPDGILSNSRAALVTVEAVQHALNAGANPDARNSGWDETTLGYAAHNGLKEVARILLDAGAQIDSTNKGDNTPLMEAAICNEVPIAQLLIERGALVNFRNRLGKSPLMVAASFCRTDFVQFLLDNGAEVNAKDRLGNSALHYAENPSLFYGQPASPQAQVDTIKLLKAAGPVDPLLRERDETGPARPDVERPDRSDLLNRMKRIDPDQGRTYRQRSGE